MATTISKRNDNPVERDGDAPSQQEEGVVFHKHCQATVCSAFGTQEVAEGEGNGKTWHIIQDLTLQNLPDAKVRFQANTGNITQDLATILQLIDDVAGASNVSFNMKFVDSNGTPIQSKPINPITNQEYEFNLDKGITLKVNGQELKFHTMSYNPATDNLAITLPTKTLSFMINGTQVGSADVIMDQDKTIELFGEGADIQSLFTEADKNIKAVYTVPSGAQFTVVPGTGVYRIDADSDVTPSIDLSNYVNNENDIIQFELRVFNNGVDKLYVKTPSAFIDVADEDTEQLNRVNFRVAKTGSYGVEVGHIIVIRFDAYMKEQLLGHDVVADHLTPEAPLAFLSYNLDNNPAITPNTFKYIVGIRDHELDIDELEDFYAQGVAENVFNAVDVQANQGSQTINSIHYVSLPTARGRIDVGAFKNCAELEEVNIP